MGAAISDWNLANAVSSLGQLGVVSGTALDLALSRRLQLGDPGGNIRRALQHFPVPSIAQKIMDTYFISGGKAEDKPFRNPSMFSIKPARALLELNIAGNFVEVFLAKEGHNGPVGINYLEKIQMPNLSAIYGAMLAGVDYILMGAGIPKEIPGIIDRLVHHGEVSMKINAAGAVDALKMVFEPQQIIHKHLPALTRPKFVPIIASAILAMTLHKKSTGEVNGFIIEGPTAGGHNAPPRGAMRLNEEGEPIYGDKDLVDLERIQKLGLPFWLAGSYGKPEKLSEALSLGAGGVQVGTAFAFCEESGLAQEYKQKVLKKVAEGTATVRTDPLASPTGFPFKAVELEDTNSEEDVYLKRKRICDLGFLREVYIKKDGAPGYRCPSEPVETYVKKGGRREDAAGRKCLCNSLMANAGYPQVQKDGSREKALLTAGDDIVNLGHFLKGGRTSYSAKDVIEYILQEQPDAATKTAGVRRAAIRG
jgi:nitronate monooxygenase